MEWGFQAKGNLLKGDSLAGNVRGKKAEKDLGNRREKAGSPGRRNARKI